MMTILPNGSWVFGSFFGVVKFGPVGSSLFQFNPVNSSLFCINLVSLVAPGVYHLLWSPDPDEGSPTGVSGDALQVVR